MRNGAIQNHNKCEVSIIIVRGHN